jgi:hypothetical protein
MPQQFVDRSNVIPRLEQVRRKRVSQRMAGGGAGNARSPGGVLDSALQDGLVQVMPPPFACLLIHVEPGRGLDPLSLQRGRQHRHAILAAFPVSNRELTPIEVMCFTRSSAHSSSRSPAPYISDAISHA